MLIDRIVGEINGKKVYTDNINNYIKTDSGIFIAIDFKNRR